MAKSRKRKFKETIDDIIEKKRMVKAEEVYAASSPSIKRPREKARGPVLPALPDGHLGASTAFYSRKKKRKGKG